MTVSKMLGHCSTTTTEGYYCSMAQTDAMNKATEVFALKMQGGQKRRLDAAQMPKGFEFKGTSPQSTPVNGGESEED